MMVANLRSAKNYSKISSNCNKSILVSNNFSVFLGSHATSPSDPYNANISTNVDSNQTAQPQQSSNYQASANPQSPQQIHQSNLPSQAHQTYQVPT